MHFFAWKSCGFYGFGLFNINGEFLSPINGVEFIMDCKMVDEKLPRNWAVTIIVSNSVWLNIYKHCTIYKVIIVWKIFMEIPARLRIRNSGWSSMAGSFSGNFAGAFSVINISINADAHSICLRQGSLTLQSR